MLNTFYYEEAVTELVLCLPCLELILFYAYKRFLSPSHTDSKR